MPVSKPKIKCCPEIDLEIGDTKEVDFHPHVKLMAWDNECNLSIRFNGGSGEAVITEETKAHVWERGIYKVRMRQVNNDTPDGPQLQVVTDVTLLSKPLSNVLNFTVRSKNIKAILQPHGTVTEKELERMMGITRITYDDNVINSYAIFATGGRQHNKYKTGKITHILRRSAVDATGTSVWCHQVLDLVGETLTITIPQDFLDNAAYPVVVD